MEPLVFMAMPAALPFGVLGIAAAVLAIWRRDRRLRGQREMLRRAYELGEEILGASSADQILTKVKVVVPRIFGVTSAELYLHNRHAKTLEAVGRSGADQHSIPLSAPPAGSIPAVRSSFPKLRYCQDRLSLQSYRLRIAAPKDAPPATVCRRSDRRKYRSSCSPASSPTRLGPDA